MLIFSWNCPSAHVNWAFFFSFSRSPISGENFAHKTHRSATYISEEIDVTLGPFTNFPAPSLSISKSCRIEWMTGRKETKMPAHGRSHGEDEDEKIFSAFLQCSPLAILWNSPCKMQKLQIKSLVMHEENEIKYKPTLLYNLA